MIQIKNPIVDGWYADPEARFYNGKYYIYVTRSNKTLNLDVFSSVDLVNWEKHEEIVDMAGFPHVHGSVWAPTVTEKNGRYYLVFASNDIHSDEEPGGLEIAVSDKPEGPFCAFLPGPLVGEFHNGAQPIDAHFFQDRDGTVYLYYGGWRHCNVCRMKEDMTGFLPVEGENCYKEITPEDYVEAPCMIREGDTYYFMWSAGDWGDGSYHVNYAVSNSPIGGFGKATAILASQLPLAAGPGHHGVFYLPDRGEYLIVYHRRIPGDTIPQHRILCIDRMKLHNGIIEPIVMTDSWTME